MNLVHVQYMGGSDAYVRADLLREIPRAGDIPVAASRGDGYVSSQQFAIGGCGDGCALFGLCGLIETGKCPATAGCPRAFPCCSLIPCCCCCGSVVTLQSIPLNGAWERE